MSDDMLEAKLELLRTIQVHREHLKVALQKVVNNLRLRMHEHDLSKFRDDEFSGFARINRGAKEFPYGSVQYKALMDSERPTINLHTQRNSHHPEYWESGEGLGNVGIEDMGLFDVIEMVCDWWAAFQSYEAQRKPEDRATWGENIQKQHARFQSRFPPQFWWVIMDVALFLAPKDYKIFD